MFGIGDRLQKLLSVDLRAHRISGLLRPVLHGGPVGLKLGIVVQRCLAGNGKPGETEQGRQVVSVDLLTELALRELLCPDCLRDHRLKGALCDIASQVVRTAKMSKSVKPARLVKSTLCKALEVHPVHRRRR